ncbi:hypothetical protein KUTeg_008611 [Tegillarca granosa]|uniref:Uncharacterized protein n=1 Tax=Tegillarca granosa TaxID=220873 RepID=A0ABQ9FCP8_TEGGR|nr:hypothetical protein KUTeg_008611 [Tegillarca granosa]
MKGLFQLLALVCLLELAFCWKNKWDKPLNFQCPTGQAISWIKSIHNNHREDRLFDFRCTNKCPKANSCHWTGYINNYDQRVDFVCPSGGMISGFKSVHSNHHEDRRWRVYCCRNSLTEL